MRFPSSIKNLFFSTRQQDKASLDRLPNEVLVCILCDYLEYPDILALREVRRLMHGRCVLAHLVLSSQTSQFYADLTNQPVVWTRLLKRTSGPLPHLPPEAHHNLHNLRSDQLEQLFKHAYDVDQAWMQPGEQTVSRFLDIGEYVSEMVVLPGGRYIVASVSDETRVWWQLVVYDTASADADVPVARYSTPTRPYGLQAKFMEYQGHRCIVLGFLARKWKNMEDENK